GRSHIDLLAIRRRTPLTAAQVSPTACARLPENGAILIGIEGMHHPGLLRDDENPALPAELHENRGLPEVEIRAFGLRTVGLLRTGTGNVVGVVLRQLTRPKQFTRLEVHGEHGITGL